MIADHPDFYEGDTPLPLWTMSLLADATPEQIAVLTTLFDVLGDPSYDCDRSECQVELGRTRRWFSGPEWSAFISRSAALMGNSAAFSFSLTATSPFVPAFPSSAAALPASDVANSEPSHAS